MILTNSKVSKEEKNDEALLFIDFVSGFDFTLFRSLPKTMTYHQVYTAPS